VLLLGVGSKQLTGIPGFEAKDLEREVRKLAGADGPGWDYEQIPVDDERDVIAVVVDPPTGRIWPCHADGEGLNNGDVYIRGDGDTRKATGAELVGMLERANSAQGLPPIEVHIGGRGLAVRLDDDGLRRWVEDTTDGYFDQIAPDPSPFAFRPQVVDRRSVDEFERQVEQWRESSLANPTAGVHELIARLGEGIQLRVTNPSRKPLREVRVDVYVEGATALEWEARRDNDPVSLFPLRPRAWGSEHPLYPGIAPNARYIPAGFTDRSLDIVQRGPAHLAFTINLLRPMEMVSSSDDEVVLFISVDVEHEAPLPVRWTLSSGDIEDLLEGTTSIPVRSLDLRDLLDDGTGGEHKSS
jgi:hypothetical protein